MNDSSAAPIFHTVFFTLHDRSPEAIAALVADARKRLANHAGVQHLSVGRRGDGFDRPVNDQDFDVALNLVFDNREAHDAYQFSPTHVAFVEAHKPTWARVRVFDSLLD